MGRAERVFLVGPMGAGKSTIGRHLAELLRRDFLDCDQEIERHTGASIALIFEIEGEAGFRRREAAMLEELTRRDGIVLATGGGAVLAESNRKLLRERGIVVYLHALLDTLVARTHRDRQRPLLSTGDRRQKLEEILRTREPLYREIADIIVATDQRAPGAVAQEIAAKLRTLQANANAHG
ncbi:MAG TPA: shikimate kinase AroK [Burkholderiales bacterium]